VENTLAEELTAVLAITERHDGPVAAAVMWIEGGNPVL
jgi:hypothetical protein